MCTHIHVGTHINTHTHMHAQTHQLFTTTKKGKRVVCLHHGVTGSCKIRWSTDMCSNRGEAQKVINKGEKSDTKGHVCWIPSTRIGVIVERKGVSLGGGGQRMFWK